MKSPYYELKPWALIAMAVIAMTLDLPPWGIVFAVVLMALGALILVMRKTAARRKR